MIPDAARSWMNSLTFSGTMPTRIRCVPADAASVQNARVRFMPWRSWIAWMSRRRLRARATTNSPPTMTVRLNMSPENPRFVPSSLKCICHQSVSGVVRIDTPVPVTSTATVSAARMGAAGNVNAGTVSRTRVGNGTDVIEIPSLVEASDLARNPRIRACEHRMLDIPAPRCGNISSNRWYRASADGGVSAVSAGGLPSRHRYADSVGSGRRRERRSEIVTSSGPMVSADRRA